MPLTIAPESPLTRDARHLIDGSQAALLEVFSPDEIFTFSPEGEGSFTATGVVPKIVGELGNRGVRVDRATVDVGVRHVVTIVVHKTTAHTGSRNADQKR